MKQRTGYTNNVDRYSPRTPWRHGPAERCELSDGTVGIANHARIQPRAHRGLFKSQVMNVTGAFIPGITITSVPMGGMIGAPMLFTPGGLYPCVRPVSTWPYVRSTACGRRIRRSADLGACGSTSLDKAQHFVHAPVTLADRHARRRKDHSCSFMVPGSLTEGGKEHFVATCACNRPQRETVVLHSR